ncbi:MAG: translation initiation factor IF-6 [Candidatus Thorarchaeota archaeon]
MEIELIDFLGSQHIGVPLFAAEAYAFGPITSPPKLIDLMKRRLQADVFLVSDTILGSLVAGNSYGLVVSKVISAEVLGQLKNTQLPVYQAPEFFAFGNVALVNDQGGIISPIIPNEIRKEISDTLDVPIEPKTLANSDLVGSLAYANNNGGLFSPLSKEDEIAEIKSILKLKEVGIGSVNKGSEFVASGIFGNSKGMFIGRETTGIELMEFTRVFIP